VLTLTPHIIRIPDIREEDLKALWIGTEQNIQLSGASRQSAFGVGPFGAAPAAEEEGAEQPAEGPAPPPEEAPAAPPEAPPTAAPETTPQPGQSPAPGAAGVAPGLTVAQPRSLEQPPPAPEPKAARPGGAAEGAATQQSGVREEEGVIIPEPAEEPEQPAAPPPPQSPPPAAPPSAAQQQAPPKVEQPPAAATLQVLPSAPTLAAGSQVTVDVRVSDARNVQSIVLRLPYNPAILKFEDGREGDFLSVGGVATAFSVSSAQGAGEVIISAQRVSTPDGASGSGTLCTLVFTGVAAGKQPLSFGTASIQDPAGRPAGASLIGALVEVQ